jgi:two-component system NarL family sensor kinase
MKLKALILSFNIGLFFSNLSFAQDKKLIDSLENLVKTSNNDSVKLIAFGDLCWNYGFLDFDKALYYGKEELAMAQKLNNTKAIALAYSDIGNCYTRINQLNEALTYHEKAYKLRMQLGMDLKAAGSINNISIIYKQQGKFKQSAEYMMKALRIYESKNDSVMQALVIGNLGNLYLNMNKLAIAKKYIDESYAVANSRQVKSLLSTAYSSYTEYYILTKNYDKALYYAQQSQALVEKQNKKTDLALIYNTIGQIYLEKKLFFKAMEFYNKSLGIRQELGDDLGIGSCYKNIAYCQFLQQNYSESEANYKTAMLYFKKIDAKEYLNDCNKQLAQLYEKQKMFDKALYYLKEGKKIEDSVYNKEAENKLSELYVQYDTEKKEQQLKIQALELSRRNAYLFTALGLLILSIVIAYLIISRNKIKESNRLQKEILKQQDLATKAIIEAEERERKRIASDLHDGIGQMFSAVRMNLSSVADTLQFKNEDKKLLFDKTIDLVDESCKEVRAISHNMMPNVLLKSGLTTAVRDFIDKIDSSLLKVNLVTYGLNDRIDSNVETVLYRVIQESVNNVIKHSQANQLDIQISVEEKEITVTIEDNGKGFDASNKENFGGIGLKNIVTRVEFLKGTVEWDSSPGNGTLVAIHIPLNK